MWWGLSSGQCILKRRPHLPRVSAVKTKLKLTARVFQQGSTFAFDRTTRASYLAGLKAVLPGVCWAGLHALGMQVRFEKSRAVGKCCGAGSAAI